LAKTVKSKTVECDPGRHLVHLKTNDRVSGTCRALGAEVRLDTGSMTEASTTTAAMG
jgi:hypothetical protein